MNVNERQEPQIRSRTRAANHTLRVAQLARPLWCALGITFLIFSVCQIVEWAWLSGMDMRLLHFFHLLKGLVSSLIVGLVVGWMIIKSSPAVLTTSPPEDEWSRRPRLTEQERTRIYARWFIAMRWIAFLVASSLIVMTVRVLGLLPPEVGWPLVVTVAILAGFNLFYTSLIRWDRGASTVLLLQGYIDLILLTVLLHFSGGIENPLATMMIFHVIIAGILLSRGQCYGIAAAGSVLFGLLAWGEFSDVLEHHTLLIFPHTEHGGEILHAAHQPLFAASGTLLQTAILFLTAYFVTTLAERMRYNERRLEAMADRALADRQLLERALETTGTALRVLDRDLQPYWANTRWNEWFADQPETPHPAALHLLDGNNSLARQSLGDRRSRVTELEIGAEDCAATSTRTEGRRRVFQITTAPLSDALDNISQIVELAQDITQQKQTQVQMIRAGKLAAVGELAGQVAHEVNNPIAIISAKARLLLSDHRDEMSPKIAQELGKITDLATRVARIAQGLLSYCRPSPATRVVIDLRVPIRKSLTMIEHQTKRNSVRIEERLPRSLPAVEANANEMEQVFLNLFLNALDAMPAGGTLTVSAAPESAGSSRGPAHVAVLVEDTGTGIPEAIRERIFEPFFTTKQEGRGTGLGLSICSGLIRSHGGRIDVDTELGRGTRFTVRLPVAPPAPALPSV